MAVLKNTMDNPLVSVIIPLYNGSKYIEYTLNSIFSQSYNGYEILVIDDGSADNGPAIVSNFIEKFPERIRLLTHADKGNHGIAASRNLGIRNAKGSLVAFIDQDDLWLTEKLKKEVEALQQFPEAALIYAKTAFIDENGNEKKLQEMYRTYGQGIAGEPQNVFGKLINEDFIPNLTVVVRKNCLERVGLLDEGPSYEYEDWLLLSKLAFFYKFLFLPEILAKWRVHDNNYSAQIFHSGQFSHAEEHCTIALFSFLMKDTNVSFQGVRKFLRGRIWRFFLRVRSWGVPSETMKMHAENFRRAFPSEYRTVQIALYSSMLLPPSFAATLRRVRRRVVGV